MIHVQDVKKLIDNNNIKKDEQRGIKNTKIPGYLNKLLNEIPINKLNNEIIDFEEINKEV